MLVFRNGLFCLVSALQTPCSLLFFFALFWLNKQISCRSHVGSIYRMLAYAVLCSFWFPYIKERCYKSRLHAVNLLAGVWFVAIRSRRRLNLERLEIAVAFVCTRPRPIPLAMITRREKQFMGFPFFPIYGYGTPFSGPSGLRFKLNNSQKHARI